MTAAFPIGCDRRRRNLRLAPFLLVAALASPVHAEQAAIKGLNTWLLGSLPNDVQQVRELGVSVVRIDLPWEQVERSPNQFDWQTLDKVVGIARVNHIEILLTLRSTSSWGTTVKADPKDLYHHASRPKSMAEWERFVQGLSSRYKGQGVHYEIENEVNSDFWAGSIGDYLELLTASYRVIKTEDSAAKVLASAMACGTIFNPNTSTAQQRLNERHDQWLSPILATKAFDVINVHDYYFPGGPKVNGWTFQSYLRHIAALADEVGVKNRPIWVTEIGYISKPVSTNGRTDEGSVDKQAVWLTEAYRAAAELGVERAFWLFLRDASNVGYFGPMGLLDANNRPRPAWDAYKAISQK